MDCTDQIDSGDGMLDCVCLRWSTPDDVDYSNPRTERACEVPEIGSCIGNEPFRYIEGGASVISASYPIAPVTQLVQ